MLGQRDLHMVGFAVRRTTLYGAIDPDSRSSNSPPYLHIEFSEKVYGVSIEGTAAFHPGSASIVRYSDNRKALTYKVIGSFNYGRDYSNQPERTPGPFSFRTEDSQGITSIDLISSYENPADHCIGCGCYSLNLLKVNFTTVNPSPPPPPPPPPTEPKSNLQALEPSINPDTGTILVPWKVASSIPFSPNVWVGVEVWAGDKSNQQFKLWGLDRCVNKANCQAVETILFSQRTPIDRGNNYLITYINKNNIYKESNESDNISRKYLDDFFTEKIPDILGNRGWSLGKEYLNLWIDSDVVIKNKAINSIDWTIPTRRSVPTSWFLDPKNASDTRIIDVYNSFIQPNADGFWTTAAKNVLTSRLRDRFNANPSATSIDLAVPYNEGMSIETYHKQQFNFRIGQSGLIYYTALDGVTAAFGKFAFYAVPLGTAIKTSDGKYKIKFKQIAVHVVDSFDFNGDQELGCYAWPDKVRPPKTFGECVSNETYSWYRRMKARGGDYNIFTTPKVETLEKSVTYFLDQ